MKAQALGSNSNSSPRFELMQLGQAEDSYEKSSMLDDDRDFLNEVRICSGLCFNTVYKKKKEIADCKTSR